ncbi:MAG: radical SAM protein [Polyangia bacterium]
MALRRLPVIDSSVADAANAQGARAVANSLQIPVDTATGTAQDASSATESTQPAGAGEGPVADPRGARAQPGADPLGVLSVHFEGGRCRIACPFCYLGEREGSAGHTLVDSEALVCEALRRLPYRELAIALSEPIEPVLPLLARLVAVAGESGRPVAITTTLAVASTLSQAVLAGVARLNLSIDPWKERAQTKEPGAALMAGAAPMVDVAAVQAVLRRLPHAASADGRGRPERVLIVTLSTQRFAEQVRDHLLAELLSLPEVDRIALNAVKPPPRWCDRAFWLKTLSAIRPLLREHLDRRLFLDCYVAARLLGLGGCPARPDLSPAPELSPELSPGLSPGLDAAPPSSAGAGARPLSFRACVYQREADFVVHSADELLDRLRGFTPPARCPFPIL